MLGRLAGWLCSADRSAGRPGKAGVDGFFSHLLSRHPEKSHAKPAQQFYSLCFFLGPTNLEIGCSPTSRRDRPSCLLWARVDLPQNTPHAEPNPPTKGNSAAMWWCSGSILFACGSHVGNAQPLQPPRHLQRLLEHVVYCDAFKVYLSTAAVNIGSAVGGLNKFQPFGCSFPNGSFVVPLFSSRMEAIFNTDLLGYRTAEKTRVTAVDFVHSKHGTCNSNRSTNWPPRGIEALASIPL